jgi:hypothetical protein
LKPEKLAELVTFITYCPEAPVLKFGLSITVLIESVLANSKIVAYMTPRTLISPFLQFLLHYFKICTLVYRLLIGLTNIFVK